MEQPAYIFTIMTYQEGMASTRNIFSFHIKDLFYLKKKK